MSTPQFTRLARRLVPGERLFEEGDAGASMYVIQSGTVRIFRSIGQYEVTIAVLGKGEFFGEMALLEGLPRTASATAAEASVVVELDRPLFEEMIEDNSEIGLRLLRKLSGRLREADRQINTFLEAPDISRTLELLRASAVGTGTGTRPLPTEFNVASLAKLAGVSLRQAQKMERDLQRARILQGQPPQLTLAADAAITDYLEYLELRQRYDPLPVAELAGIFGLPEEETHHIVQRLLAARLASGEGTAQPLIDSYQHYLQLKRRFEYSASIPEGSKS